MAHKPNGPEAVTPAANPDVPATGPQGAGDPVDAGVEGGDRKQADAANEKRFHDRNREEHRKPLGKKKRVLTDTQKSLPPKPVVLSLKRTVYREPGCFISSTC